MKVKRKNLQTPADGRQRDGGGLLGLQPAFGVLLLALAGSGLAVLFVGSDLLERVVFPSMSTGLRHSLLTAQAAIVTVLAGAGVYLVMRRQQGQLSKTAEELTRLLESFQNGARIQERFENPHRVHCRDVLECQRKECPAYDAPGERCWQVVALRRAPGRPPSVDIHRCHACPVYQTSCPDKLTDLGESFNNLMFLLKEEVERNWRMRAAMVEKQKMAAIGQIAAGVADEVCNPLSSISSVAQMLRRSAPDPPVRDQLSVIEKHVQRISSVVRRLVSSSRVGTGRWETVDARKILEEALHLVSYDRRAREVDIVLDAPSSLPPTVGLRDQLQQVFFNLSLNALDAMPNGGRLTVRAAVEEGRIQVRVEDTGSGIAPEVERHVFEPFFTTKPPGHGVGLGLPVSYGIVQEHGGTIDFSSAAGKGTVFTVDLPVRDKAPDA